MKEYVVSLTGRNRKIIKNAYKKLYSDKVYALSIIVTLGASQKIGNGYVIVFADNNVVRGCVPPYQDYTNINNKFWQNVNHFASSYNSGSWGVYGNITADHVCYEPTLNPTVNLQANINNFSVIGGLWVGITTNGCGAIQMVPNTYWPQLKNWVESGGILCIIGEYNGCDSGFNATANSFLQYISSQIRISLTLPVVLGGCDASARNLVDNTNIFISGSSYGKNTVTQLNFAATSFVTIDTSIQTSSPLLAIDPNQQCFVDCCNQQASRIAYCNGGGTACP